MSDVMYVSSAYGEAIILHASQKAISATPFYSSQFKKENLVGYASDQVIVKPCNLNMLASVLAGTSGQYNQNDNIVQRTGHGTQVGVADAPTCNLPTTEKGWRERGVELDIHCPTVASLNIKKKIPTRHHGHTKSSSVGGVVKPYTLLQTPFCMPRRHTNNTTLNVTLHRGLSSHHQKRYAIYNQFLHIWRDKQSVDFCSTDDIVGMALFTVSNYFPIDLCYPF